MEHQANAARAVITVAIIRTAPSITTSIAGPFWSSWRTFLRDWIIAVRWRFIHNASPRGTMRSPATCAQGAREVFTMRVLRKLSAA